MMKEQVKSILDRVLTWSPERQEDAAEMLVLEEQDKSVYRLSDEQLEEVERRLDDPNPVFLPLEEVRARFASRGR